MQVVTKNEYVITVLLLTQGRRDHWEPKSHDRICSDYFEGGTVYQFSNY